MVSSFASYHGELKRKRALCSECSTLGLTDEGTLRNIWAVDIVSNCSIIFTTAIFSSFLSPRQCPSR